MSDVEEIDCTPPEIREKSNLATLDLLPKKSRDKYEKQYNSFVKWCEQNNITKYSENVLMGYFGDMAAKYAPPTLWSYYSMLKATLNVKNNVDISGFKKLVPFLKQKAKGHIPKRSKTLTLEEIIQFLLDASDDIYLMAKLCVIFGVAGACRADELIKLSTNDIEDKGSILIVKIPKSKTDKPRTFIITEEFEKYIKPIELYRKYIALRPAHVSHNRFFLSYRQGKCSIQPIGIHKVGSLPKKIASYLNLPDPSSYTGHCFRRTSATLFANAGGSKENLKRHGGWKSDSVAEGYVEESIFNKTKIAKTILGSTIQDEYHINNPSDKNIPQNNSEASIPTTFNKNVVSNISKSFSVSGPSTSGSINIYNASNCTFNFN